MSQFYEAQDMNGKRESWFVDNNEIYRTGPPVPERKPFYKLVGAVSPGTYDPRNHVQSVADLVRNLEKNDISDKIEVGKLLLVRDTNQYKADPRKGYDIVGRVVAERERNIHMNKSGSSSNGSSVRNASA